MLNKIMMIIIGIAVIILMIIICKFFIQGYSISYNALVVINRNKIEIV